MPLQIVAIASGIASASCIVLCGAGYATRQLIKQHAAKATKKEKSPAEIQLRKANKWLHRHHTTIGKAALACAAVHLASNLFALHLPSVLGILVLAGCIVLYRNATAKSSKRWLHVHRTIGAATVALLVVHVGTQVL